MLGISTPEYRRFMRIISPNALVFTEMVVDTTLVHMDSEDLERKIGLPTDRCVLQLGGSCPLGISKAAKRALSLGYTKMNLNCGCPSERVQNGKFGAVLMKEPLLIAQIVQEVYEQTGVVLSVKCRIGVDDIEDYASFKKMVETVRDNSPCRTFYVHARKCLLKGLSPADNRRVPPLKYEHVTRLKEELPELTVILNGGIREISQIHGIRDKVDGVMLGRKPAEDPMVFAELEWSIFNTPRLAHGTAVLAYLLQLSEKEEARQRFYKIDEEYNSALKRLKAEKEAQKGKKREEKTKEKENPHGSTAHACKYEDLRPIEPVLYGKRGCKEYKRRIADIARERIQNTEVFNRISSFFELLELNGAQTHEE